MLHTLSKIGEYLLEGKGIWSKLTSEPRLDPEKTNWVIPILLDCDSSIASLLENEKELFVEEESVIKFRYLNTELWGRRGKKCCVCSESKNLEMLKESLIGKTKSSKGSLSESYDDFYKSKPKDSLFRKALEEINKTQFDGKIFDLAIIKDHLHFSKNEEAVLFYVKIKSLKFNNGLSISLFDLEGYEEFVLEKFGNSEARTGLDYLTGIESQEVSEAAFAGRYNLNKVFQTTSFNYATDFDSLNFNKNFQLSLSTIARLDKSSDFALKRLQTRIAGIPHLVIPNYLYKDLVNLDIGGMELFINKSSDLLFRSEVLEHDVKRKLPETKIFWLNYLGFESDGNSFKIINHIKDVNSAHLKNILEVFDDTHYEFRHFIGEKYPFNLQSIYWIIPVREGSKEKKNAVLAIFKEILEQRKINEGDIFDHFISMLLCHRYGRYRQYQFKSTPNNFDFAIRDTAFKYTAFIYALKKLNLLNMEDNKPKLETDEKATNTNAEKIEDFFLKLDYTQEQKAVFYLGRVLSSVAYAQIQKGHKSKPILNKINYNGMDASALERLDLDLSEKSRQYNIHEFTESNLAKFRSVFKEEKWTLSPQKNVFYLMVGYTFGLTKE